MEDDGTVIWMSKSVCHQYTSVLTIFRILTVNKQYKQSEVSPYFLGVPLSALQFEAETGILQAHHLP